MGWLAWGRPPCLLRTVIVNLTDGATIRGALWDERGAWWVLRHAEHLRPGVDPEPIDGEVVVHRSHISFVQVLP